jgi:hypothetical protein
MLSSGDFPSVIYMSPSMQILLHVSNTTQFISVYIPLKVRSHSTGLINAHYHYDNDKLMRTLRYVTPSLVSERALVSVETAFRAPYTLQTLVVDCMYHQV